MIILMICLIFPSAATAETIFDDDFTNAAMVDMSKTSAVVDTTGGYIRLPQNKMPNAIAMLKYGDGYAVTTSDGVIISEYDAATGALHDTKIDWLTNARGLAIRQDNMNFWAIGDDYVQYCQFSGGAYSYDPALKSSGLTEVLSVSAVEGTDRAVVLSRTADGKAKITRYRAGATLAVELEKELDIDEPVAISVVDGTPDVVVVTRTGNHYLMFDDATQDYIEDTARKASGYSNIVSASANQDGTAILNDTEGKYLHYDDAGGVQQVLAYSVGQVPGAVALSIKPGAYDQAFVTEDGEVRYYTYNDATDSMTRVTDLEKTGLQLNVGYMSPREYWSKTINTPITYDEVKLTADTALPVGTNIEFYVSSDGGASFIQVNNGEWKTINPGQHFVVKAILDTTDKSVTPKILRVKLEVTTLALKDLKVLAIAFNDPTQVLPTTIFPVKVKAGAEILMEVTTVGFAEKVYADFSTGTQVTFVARSSITNEVNTWRGLFTVPVDAIEGAPITVTITAERNTKQKHLTANPFIFVNGKVTDVVDLKMTL